MGGGAGNGSPRASAAHGAGRALWAPLALIALVAAAYGQTLAFDFVWDDHYFLSNKTAIQDWAGWRRAFTSPISEYMGGMRGTERMYRPIHALVWAADRAAWGSRPAGFHFTSVLAHLAVVLLVWRLAYHLTGNAWAAAAGAALLAVHPSAVEAVAFVSARMDIFVGLGIASILLLLRTGSGRGGLPRLAGALLCFAAALGSKETAVAIPAMVTWAALAHPRWFAASGVPARRPALAARVVLFWVVLAGYGLVRRTVIGSITPVPIALADLPALGSRALAAVAAYARMTVIPGPATGILAMAPPAGLKDGHVLLGLAVVALLLAALAWLPTRHPAGALALGCYAAALVPISNLVPAYWSDVLHLAERGLYPALVGWCLFLAIGLHALAGRAAAGLPRPRRLMAFGTGTVAGVLLIVTALKAAAWRDEVTLWTSAVVSDPGSPMPRLNLSAALAQAGDLPRGQTVAREAAALFPRDPFLAYQAGLFAEQQGQLAEALRQYERAIDLGVGQQPAFRRAAFLAARLQEWEQARRWFADAAKRFPRAAWPHVGLAWYHRAQGRPDLAQASLDRAAALEPRSPERLWFLGQLAAAGGGTLEASRAYREALELDPSFVPARWELALLAEREGRIPEAIGHWERLAQASQGPPQRDAQAHLRRLRGMMAEGEAAPSRQRAAP